MQPTILTKAGHPPSLLLTTMGGNHRLAKDSQSCRKKSSILGSLSERWGFHLHLLVGAVKNIERCGESAMDSLSRETFLDRFATPRASDGVDARESRRFFVLGWGLGWSVDLTAGSSVDHGGQTERNRLPKRLSLGQAIVREP